MAFRVGVLLMLVANWASGTLAAQPPDFIINAGSAVRLTATAFNQERRLLATGGQTGLVEVFNVDQSRLVGRFQAGRGRVRALALNAEGDRLAVVDTDGRTRHRLSVWDWKARSLAFERPLEEVPLLLHFSPLGTWVFGSRADWDSLICFDAVTGRPRRLTSGGFGIVTFALVSATERTLATYVPASGSIAYWDLATGALRSSPLRTTADLTGVRYLSDRYMVGRRGGGLQVVDLSSGVVAGRASLPSIDATYHTDPENLRVLIHHPADESLVVYRMGQAGLFLESRTPVPGLSEVTSYHADGNTGFAVGSDGRLYRVAGGSVTPLPKKNMTPVLEMVSGDFGVVLAAESGLFSLTLPSPDTPIIQPRAVSIRSPAGLAATGAGTLAVLDPGLRRVIELDETTFAVRSESPPSDLPLIRVLGDGAGGVLTLDRVGTLRRYHLGRLTFTHAAVSTGCVTLSPDGRLFGGRSASAGSPLFAVDMRTGETVDYRLPGVFVVSRLEASGDRLFLTGLRREGAGPATSFVGSVRFSNPEQLSILAEFAEEDLAGDLAVDDGVVYAVLAGEVVSRGRLNRDYRAPRGTPRSLALFQDYLLVATAEGWISVYSREDGAFIGELALIDDGTWVFLSAEGRHIASPRFDVDLLAQKP